MPGIRVAIGILGRKAHGGEKGVGLTQTLQSHGFAFVQAVRTQRAVRVEVAVRQPGQIALHHALQQKEGISEQITGRTGGLDSK